MKRALFLLSTLFAMAPFAAGLIRALITGSDLRMLWMAVASFIAGMVVTVAVSRGRVAVAAGQLAALIFVVTTIAAATGAMMLGATAQFGVWAVSIVFGACWAASTLLAARSRAVTA